MTWTEVAEEEWFKFGAGEPEKSNRAFIYPVGVHGVCTYLRMSEVKEGASDCPGLVGPSELARWKVTFRFGDKQVVPMGSTRPMILTPTRHPGLNLLEFGDKKAYQQQQLRDLHDNFVNTHTCSPSSLRWVSMRMRLELEQRLVLQKDVRHVRARLRVKKEQKCKS